MKIPYSGTSCSISISPRIRILPTTKPWKLTKVLKPSIRIRPLGSISPTANKIVKVGPKYPPTFPIVPRFWGNSKSKRNSHKPMISFLPAFRTFRATSCPDSSSTSTVKRLPTWRKCSGKEALTKTWEWKSLYSAPSTNVNVPCQPPARSGSTQRTQGTASTLKKCLFFTDWFF